MPAVVKLAEEIDSLVPDVGGYGMRSSLPATEHKAPRSVSWRS